MNDHVKELYAKFASLTPAQHRLMASHCASTAKSSNRTGEKLLSMGLVEKIERFVRVRRVVDYEVPVPIHMVYCGWCEELERGK